jgi:uncharacterized protein (TIRG00374 family)
MESMSVKRILSWITLVLVALVLFFARHELVKAWLLLESVNLFILALIVPLILLSFYAATEITFSYLRAKGSIEETRWTTRARMALELNFVNHTLPSGGVSGISYMTWRLGKLGVTAGRAASAQMVRYISGFIATAILIPFCVLIVTVDGSINRWIILVSSMIMFFMFFAIVGMVYLVSNQVRMQVFARWSSRTANRIVTKLTHGRKRVIVRENKILEFFEEIHNDYLELRRDRRVLIKPIMWGIIFTVLDAMIFAVTFWALGTPVNPAPILIAYTLASVAGFIVVTPGGAGAYEAIMVAFLAVAGVSSGTAIAGILLSRVIILLVTIAVGYLFYQQALSKYGKQRHPA